MSDQALKSAPQRDLPIGYLRAFVTLLVLFHHSVLAYDSQAPKPGGAFNHQPMLWTAFPVVDTQSWSGFDLMVGFNDIFFMALMFFVSGLFVSDSLARKGSLRFVGERLLRLGIPFAVAVAVLAPLAYFPAYLQSGGKPEFTAFWSAWTSLPYWPSGPAWFLWVLLVLGALAGAINLLIPRWSAALGRLASGADRHPWRFFFAMVLLSAGAYIALSLAYDPYSWLSYGPFLVQASRMLHYAVYFFVGVAVGANGLSKGLLAPDGRLARRWWLWPPLAVAAFVLVMAVVIAAITAKGQPVAMWETIGGAGFALSCGFSAFACIAIFVRFFRRRVAIFDSLARNAYGMYLVHYAFASWIQYTLLPARLSGLEKGLIVFSSVVILSWITTALLRRVPVVARII